MGTVPVMHTFTTGEVVTASNLNNNTVTLASFVLASPYAYVRQTSAQNIVNSSFTPLSWSSADINTDGMWSAGAPTRFTAQTPGWYEFSGAWALVAGTAGGRRICMLAVNSSQINAGQTCMSGTASASGVVPDHPVFLSATDFVEIQALQDSGGTVATASATAVTQAWARAKWAHS